MGHNDYLVKRRLGLPSKPNMRFVSTGFKAKFVLSSVFRTVGSYFNLLPWESEMLCLFYCSPSCHTIIILTVVHVADGVERVHPAAHHAALSPQLPSPVPPCPLRSAHLACRWLDGCRLAVCARRRRRLASCAQFHAELNQAAHQFCLVQEGRQATIGLGDRRFSGTEKG